MRIERFYFSGNLGFRKFIAKHFNDCRIDVLNNAIDTFQRNGRLNIQSTLERLCQWN